MSELVLDVAGLTVRARDGREVVHGVDLRVASGAFVGLVGESGSGKTLTARAALGLLPRRMDSVATRHLLMGHEVAGLPAGELRRLLGTTVGYVPQNTVAYLHPLMRVRSQIADGFLTWRPESSRRQALARARELLASTGLADPDRVLGSYPWELSGGQRQRVNIAMALMGDPRLVIADEPTAALDIVTQRQVGDLLAMMAREHGAAVLLISHDLTLVRQRCERVSVMRAGRIVDEGPVGEVFGQGAGHDYMRALAAAAPRIGMPRGTRLAEGQ